MNVQPVTSERRGDFHNNLQTLLVTRTETLSLYSQLAAIRPFKPNQKVQLLLQEFCEVLVDYTASAHFQLYRFLEEGTERREPVRVIAAKVYPRIAEITSSILDFNEKYDCGDHCDNLTTLVEDLSQLGEMLADRIVLEDKIIAAFSMLLD